MLEEKLETLAQEVAKLSSAVGTTNALLTDFLSKTETTAPEVSDTAPEVSDTAPTLKDVREALVEFSEVFDREATLDLLKRHIEEGDRLVVGAVPEHRYGSLIDACRARIAAEAADGNDA